LGFEIFPGEKALCRLGRAAAPILLLALISASIAYNVAATAEVPRMNVKVLVYQAVPDENKTHLSAVMYIYNDTMIIPLHGFVRMLKYDPATNTLQFWCVSDWDCWNVKSSIEMRGSTDFFMRYLITLLPKAFVNNLRNIVSMGWLNIEIIPHEGGEVYRTTLKVNASAIQVADTSYMGYPAIMVRISNAPGEVIGAVEAYWRTDGVLLYVRYYAQYYGGSVAPVREVMLVAEDDFGAKDAKETLTQISTTRPATQTTVAVTTPSQLITETPIQTLYTATTTSAVERTTTQLPKSTATPYTSAAIQTPTPSTTPTIQSPITTVQTSTPTSALSTEVKQTITSPTTPQTTTQGTQTTAGIQINTVLVIIGVVAIVAVAIIALILKRR